MALVDTTWYVNSVGHAAVTARPQNTAVAAGVLRRQFTAPAVGSERVFVCIVAGTTANVTDATWVLTRGAKTTDGTVTWMECSGQAGLNGDLTNTATWAQVKAATPAVLGQVIKRSNSASYQICTTAGAMSASEPAFSDTAGVTTTDTTAVWTSLGPVGGFTGGQAPHARLNNVFGTNWFASGNTVYVGNNHAETQATSMILNPASALMSKTLCHNAAGPYPPTALTTGATITTTGATSLTLSGQGSFYFYGIVFSASTSTSGGLLVGSSSVPQVHNWYYFDNCSLQMASTATAPIMVFGNASATAWCTVVLDNTTVRFATATSRLVPRLVQLVWRNTGQVLAPGSSVPAALFQATINTDGLSTVLLEGLDLSQCTGTLWSPDTFNIIGGVTIKDCKLHASATVTTPINTGMTVQLVASASDATSYKSSRHTYEAVETTETSIVRTGGYQDPQGQVQSRKIVTTANTQWLRPYAAQPLAVWNSVIGSPVTVTVCGILNADVLPANDEIWLECSYLGSGTFPIGSTVTTTKDNVLDAGSAGVSDGSSWSNFALATTLDGALGTNTTLSNGGLTATHGTTTSGGGATSLAFRTTGKYYFEGVFTVVGNGFTGIKSQSVTYATFISTSASDSVMVPAAGGAIWSNGNLQVGSLGAFVAGDVACWAFDFTNLKFWVRKNGGNWNNDGTANPATNTGGYSFIGGVLAPTIAWASGGAIGDNVTLNFGGTPYAQTRPSGFGDWSIPQPFKLVATLPSSGMAGYLIPQVKVARPSATFYIDPLAVVT